MKKVSVIIPIYNGRGYLEDLLPSVKRQDYDDYEVIIVDDASPDYTIIPYIKEKFPEFTVIKNKKNIGFPLSCNAGIRQARSKYICLLNSDTVIDKSYIRKHAQFLEKNGDVGILGCKIIGADGRIQSSGVIFKDGFPHYLTDDINEVRYVDHVDFVGAFIRREIFEKFGLLSPDYFMKFDDCDFCLRVAKRPDYRFAVLPEGLITHFGRSNSMNSFDNIYYYCRNVLVLQKKFFPDQVRKTIFNEIFAELFSRLMDGFKRPSSLPANLKMIFRGIAGFTAGLKFKAENSKDYLEKL